MNITHAAFVTLPVADQDKARDFYVNTLGFEVLVDQAVGSQRWIQVGPPGAQTSFTLVPAGKGGFELGSARGIMLESSDIDADCAALAKAGVPVSEPVRMPWGRRQTNFTDPDGNSFTLSCALPVGA
ncbi:VOC family protein [Streptomyces sp. NPDC091265]|uniref:VOC family protein n=1 Tax=unclassified Streptomyces TaxID=2593676 RepID=UPI00344DE654